MSPDTARPEPFNGFRALARHVAPPRVDARPRATADDVAADAARPSAFDALVERSLVDRSPEVARESRLGRRGHDASGPADDSTPGPVPVAVRQAPEESRPAGDEAPGGRGTGAEERLGSAQPADAAGAPAADTDTEADPEATACPAAAMPASPTTAVAAPATDAITRPRPSNLTPALEAEGGSGATSPPNLPSDLDAGQVSNAEVSPEDLERTWPRLLVRPSMREGDTSVRERHPVNAAPPGPPAAASADQIADAPAPSGASEAALQIAAAAVADSVAVAAAGTGVAGDADQVAFESDESADEPSAGDGDAHASAHHGDGGEPLDARRLARPESPGPERAAAGSTPPTIMVAGTQPSSPSHGSTAVSGTAAPVPTPLAPDTADRLVQSMRLQYVRGGGDAVVHIRPEHMGPVAVSLRVDGGSVTATVTAEHPAVVEWLQANQHLLREGLQASGLHLERLVVTRDGESPYSARDQASDPRRRGLRRRPSQPESTFEITM